MSDEGTIVQKQGEIIAVQPTKTGWTEIHLQEAGKQYPYKASTKIEAIIEAAQAALFKEAVLTAKEVDSGNPNPNRPGFNYVNRTAMKVEVGGTVSQVSGAKNQGGASTPDETRASIERQTVVKASLPTYLGSRQMTEDELFAFMDRAAGWIKGSPAVATSTPATDEYGDVPFE